ncbi:MAG: EAL domain-containing protein [Lachnospiraceae bacterium]|nr:EAL domain-containing protein [Lachnospiraceae bacterium]
MLNIEIQCGSIVLVVLVMYLSFREKRINLLSRRLFFYTLISTLISLIADIFSIFCIVYAENLPAFLTIAACKFYLLTLITEGYFGLLYAGTDFFEGSAFLKFRNIFGAILGIGCILIIVLPLGYYFDDKCVYSYGEAAYATYLIVAVFLISTFITGVILGKKTNPIRRRAILLWMLFWIIAATIQISNPEYLLGGFASALGMILLYAELENPKEGMDRVTGLYSTNTLRELMEDYFERGKSFAGMNIVINIPNKEVTTERSVLIAMSKYLRVFKKAYLFRNVGQELVMIFNSAAEMYAAYDRIRYDMEDNKIFGDMENNMKPVLKFYLMPSSNVAQSSDDVLLFHSYFAEDLTDKDCVVVDASAVTRISDFRRVKAVIAEALSKNRLEVFYQPIYSTEEKKFVSAEALARIRDEEEKIVMPGIFIPVAEETGMIVQVGEEVFRQVCRFIREYDIRKLGLEYIEINLSVAQCEKEKLAEEYMEIINEYGVDPSMINLEITETGSISAKSTLMRNMDRLRNEGVSFSLDDFGTGRSNLDYFVNMPVDIIKFDREFTSSYFKNGKARQVMASVIQMIKNMGLKIVTEGIETKEQLDDMALLGVDYIQGFYFSKPLPQGEFLEYIRKNL